MFGSNFPKREPNLVLTKGGHQTITMQTNLVPRLLRKRKRDHNSNKEFNKESCVDVSCTAAEDAPSQMSLVETELNRYLLPVISGTIILDYLQKSNMILGKPYKKITLPDFPVDISIFEDRVYVALCNKICVFCTNTLTLLTEWSLSGTAKAITVYKGCLLVVVWYFLPCEQDGIQMFTLNGQFITHCPEFGAFQSPRGLAATPDEAVLYTSEDAAVRMSMISHGSCVTHRLVECKEIQMPVAIACDREQLYVCDSVRNAVHVLSLTGKWKFSIGSRGTKIGSFRHPSGIALHQNHVYVCDKRNHRIQVFHRITGEFVGYWGDFGIQLGQFQRPNGLAVDLFDHLWVCDHANKRLQVFI